MPYCTRVIRDCIYCLNNQFKDIQKHSELKYTYCFTDSAKLQIFSEEYNKPLDFIYNTYYKNIVTMCEQPLLQLEYVADCAYRHDKRNFSDKSLVNLYSIRNYTAFCECICDIIKNNAIYRISTTQNIVQYFDRKIDHLLNVTKDINDVKKIYLTILTAAYLGYIENIEDILPLTNRQNLIEFTELLKICLSRFADISLIKNTSAYILNINIGYIQNLCNKANAYICNSRKQQIDKYRNVYELCATENTIALILSLINKIETLKLTDSNIQYLSIICDFLIHYNSLYIHLQKFIESNCTDNSIYSVINSLITFVNKVQNHKQPITTEQKNIIKLFIHSLLLHSYTPYTLLLKYAEKKDGNIKSIIKNIIEDIKNNPEYSIHKYANEFIVTRVKPLKKITYNNICELSSIRNKSKLYEYVMNRFDIARAERATNSALFPLTTIKSINIYRSIINYPTDTDGLQIWLFNDYYSSLYNAAVASDYSTDILLSHIDIIKSQENLHNLLKNIIANAYNFCTLWEKSSHIIKLLAVSKRQSDLHFANYIYNKCKSNMELIITQYSHISNIMSSTIEGGFSELVCECVYNREFVNQVNAIIFKQAKDHLHIFFKIVETNANIRKELVNALKNYTNIFKTMLKSTEHAATNTLSLIYGLEALDKESDVPLSISSLQQIYNKYNDIYKNTTNNLLYNIEQMLRVVKIDHNSCFKKVMLQTDSEDSFINIINELVNSIKSTNTQIYNIIYTDFINIFNRYRRSINYYYHNKNCVYNPENIDFQQHNMSIFKEISMSFLEKLILTIDCILCGNFKLYEQEIIKSIDKFKKDNNVESFAKLICEILKIEYNHSDSIFNDFLTYFCTQNIQPFTKLLKSVKITQTNFEDIISALGCAEATTTFINSRIRDIATEAVCFPQWRLYNRQISGKWQRLTPTTSSVYEVQQYCPHKFISEIDTYELNTIYYSFEKVIKQIKKMLSLLCKTYVEQINSNTFDNKISINERTISKIKEQKDKVESTYKQLNYKTKIDKESILTTYINSENSTLYNIETITTYATLPKAKIKKTEFKCKPIKIRTLNNAIIEIKKFTDNIKFALIETAEGRTKTIYTTNISVDTLTAETKYKSIATDTIIDTIHRSVNTDNIQHTQPLNKNIVKINSNKQPQCRNTQTNINRTLQNGQSRSTIQNAPNICSSVVKTVNSNNKGNTNGNVNNNANNNTNDNIQSNNNSNNNDNEKNSINDIAFTLLICSTCTLCFYQAITYYNMLVSVFM